MLKLKLQYFGHLTQRANSLGKTDAGKDWGQKGMTEDEMVGWHHQLNGMNLSKLQHLMKNMETWHAAVHGVVESRTGLREGTTKLAGWTVIMVMVTINKLHLHDVSIKVLSIPTMFYMLLSIGYIVAQMSLQLNTGEILIWTCNLKLQYGREGMKRQEELKWGWKGRTEQPDPCLTPPKCNQQLTPP